MTKLKWKGELTVIDKLYRWSKEPKKKGMISEVQKETVTEDEEIITWYVYTFSILLYISVFNQWLINDNNVFTYYVWRKSYQLPYYHLHHYKHHFPIMNLVWLNCSSW